MTGEERPDPPGHADTPRQDSQRPAAGDHADAGGQESTGRRAARTQIEPPATPPGVPAPPGALHVDPPLPDTGRQSQRPGQHGRMQDRPGARDLESLKSEEEEGFGPDRGAAPNRGDSHDGTNAATRRSSVAPTSGRHDKGVGAEEPPPHGRRPGRGRTW
jgi:hypothetical protein